MRPLRNTLLSAIVTGSRVAAVAVTMLLLARVLGPHGFGAFMYALTLATTLAVVPDYGFSLQLVARIAGEPNRARALLRSARIGKCYLVAVALLLGVIWSLVQSPSTRQLQMVGILFLSATALSFGQLNTYVFRGIDRFEFDALTSAAQNAALVIGVLIVAARGGDAMSVAWVYLAVRSFYLALTTILLRRVPPDSEGTAVMSPFGMLREGLSYGIHTAIAVLCVNVDSLILAAYRGDTAVGYYQAGMRLVFAAALLPEILTSGLFPTLSRAMSVGELNEAIRVGKIMNRYLLVSGAAAAGLLMVIPGTVRHVLYGPSYSSVDVLLPWFGLAIFLRCASATYGASITAAGAQVSRMFAGITATVVSISANFLLIPHFGIQGALAALIVTQSILLLMYAVLTRRELDAWLIDQRAVLGVAATIVLAVVALQVQTLAPNLVTVGCPLALALCALRAAVSDDDWQRLRSAVARRTAVYRP